MPRGKKWAFKSLADVTAKDTEAIIELIHEHKFAEAEAAYHKLCGSIKDLPNYEAFMLARKLVQESGVPQAVYQAYARKRKQETKV